MSTRSTVVSLMLVSGLASAQEAARYQTPTPELAALVNAAPTPTVSVDSKGEWLLIMERSAQPSIAELAQPELRLAGIRINPANNGPSRAAYVEGMFLKNLATGVEKRLTGLPENPLISTIKWSPDESKIAFTVSEEEQIRLYVVTVSTGEVARVSPEPLNAAMGTPYYWISDSQSLLARLVPSGRGAAPQPAKAPDGPTIQENLGRKTMAPTFQDLLKDAADEEQFAYYCTSQLALISLNGSLRKIGEPALFVDAEPSPDGQFVLTQTLSRPFSYLVPARLFPMTTALLETGGKPVKTLFERPLVENVPWGSDAVPDGPRSFSWRADVPATVYWVEARDGGDPQREVEVRDEVLQLPVPFDGPPQPVYAARYRFAGVYWGDAHTALLMERWWKTRRTLTQVVNPSDPAQVSLLMDRSSEDSYTNPGYPELSKNRYGRNVLYITPEKELFMLGAGASPEGNRPFVDRLSLKTGASTRLWRSEGPVYEQPVTILDRAKLTVLTTRETPEEIPNYCVRKLKPGKKENPLQQVTTFPHPYPDLKGVQKQVLRYQRDDGVALTATLYLPVGYKKEDGPLPTLLWAYPREFKDKDAASQVVGSPFQFNRISYWGAAAFVTRGYAILDNATIPIVGEGQEEPNDTYVKQLVASAKAAIDEGVRLGVVDASRVGVGGHSYGAFMTANLLTHSGLFKAGLARSGAYNRTLTPFGFQNEQRTYWQAPEVYNAMSPFMNADKMKTPLLLIHGEADNNTGTFPMQSERYYTALKGMGATTRLVMLPYESHGYTAKESLLHMLWEMDQWLETYVKKGGDQ